ncbi:MAG: hypothetical protein HS115_17825 [Spirochaetales bacterium]|nr:hypothetical protein [Spirochaetales bacterium]
MQEKRPGKMSNSHQDPLSRFLRCAACQSTLTPARVTKKSGRQYQYYAHRCKALYGRQAARPQAEVFALIDRTIAELRNSESFLTNLNSYFRAEREKGSRQFHAQVDGINLQIQSIRKKKDRLIDLFAEDSLDLADLRARRAQYDQEIADLLDQQKAILNTDENRLLDSICESLDRIKSLPVAYLKAKNITSKARLLREMVQEARVSESGVELTWKAPFGFIMQPKVLELKPHIRPSSGQTRGVHTPDEDWRRREKSKTKSSSADSVPAQIRAILEEVKMDFRLWLMRSAG